MNLFNWGKNKKVVSTLLQPINVSVSVPAKEILKDILVKGKVRLGDKLLDIKEIELLGDTDTLVISVLDEDYKIPEIPDSFFSN